MYLRGQSIDGQPVRDGPTFLDGSRGLANISKSRDAPFIISKYKSYNQEINFSKIKLIVVFSFEANKK